MSPQFSVLYSATGFGKGVDFILVFGHAEFVTPALEVNTDSELNEWISHHIFTDLKQPGQGRLHFLF